MRSKSTSLKKFKIPKKIFGFPTALFATGAVLITAGLIVLILYLAGVFKKSRTAPPAQHPGASLSSVIVPHGGDDTGPGAPTRSSITVSPYTEEVVVGGRNTPDPSYQKDDDGGIGGPAKPVIFGGTAQPTGTVQYGMTRTSYRPTGSDSHLAPTEPTDLPTTDSHIDATLSSITVQHGTREARDKAFDITDPSGGPPKKNNKGSVPDVCEGPGCLTTFVGDGEIAGVFATDS